MRDAQTSDWGLTNTGWLLLQAIQRGVRDVATLAKLIGKENTEEIKDDLEQLRIDGFVYRLPYDDNWELDRYRTTLTGTVIFAQLLADQAPPLLE